MNEQKPNNTLIYVMIAGAVIWYLHSQGKITIPGLKPATPTVVVPGNGVPSAEMQSLVAPVKAIVSGKPKASELGDFFFSAADVVKRDSTRINSTSQVAAWLRDANTLRVQNTDLVGAFPGVSKAIDDTLKASIGDEQGQLTPDKRKRLAETFEAISWACGG